MSKRAGDWIQTYTGRRFWPLDPCAEDVCIEDIAHHLALICRFGGACRIFYSVAQHSVLVSQFCADKDALWGLLHDAAEAYVGDMVRPLKRQLLDFASVEKKVQKAICQCFGLLEEMPASVKATDNRLLFTEARDLVRLDPNGWDAPVEPFFFAIEPEPPTLAEERFLTQFAKLKGGKA